MNSILKYLDISEIKRISFRNDINGLRAIAVLSVVLYHANFEIFRGGWLGVDIFFVISGYLISNIIISELNESTFSFRNFYLRRIKRILPALFSTFLLTVPFALVLLPPKGMAEYLDSMFASIFFYANYYFMNLDFYVAESTKIMPFLHTWSLAIEEQYYILFPLFALLLYKKTQKYFTLIIGLITIYSIYINTLSQEVTKFYQLQFRTWELFAGVLVMVTSSNIRIKHLEKIGLPLLIFSIFYFDDEWINHIEPKLISIAGITLIIFSNTNDTVLTKVLNLKIVSLIGLSSYSIYLLHQPVFAFMRIIDSDNKIISFENPNYFLSTQKSFSIVIFLIFFGYLHYYFVEKKIPEHPYFMKLLLVVLLVLLSFIFYGRGDIGYKNRFNTENQLVQNAMQYQDISNFDLIINNNMCHKTSTQESVTSLCSVTNSEDYREIIVLGDSHARLLLKPFADIITTNSIKFATGDSCIYFANIVNPDCKRSDKEELSSAINELENKIFIYIADLQDKIDDPKKNIINNLPLTLNELAKKNYVIVVKQVPPFPVNVGNRILNNTELREIKYSKDEWEFNERMIKLEEIYNGIKNKNIFFVDTFNIFCNEIESGYCVGADSKNIYIYDDNHPSEVGSKLIVDKIKEKIEIINKSK